MERLDTTAPRALRTALAQQPLSQAKVRFAWALAAGVPLSRAADAFWRDGVLHLEPKSESWRRELVRLRPLLLARLSSLLGPGIVRNLTVGATFGSAS